MKYLLLVIVAFQLFTLILLSQDQYVQNWKEIDIQDTSFKNLVTSFLGKTPQEFMSGMYEKGYIYLSMGCIGDKKDLIHFVEITYSSGVRISLHIGAIKVSKYNKYDIPIREFEDVKDLPIQMIGVEKTVRLKDQNNKLQRYYIKNDEVNKK